MSHEPRIYFVKSKRSNAIKIGTSSDVLTRLNSLSCDQPDRLVLLAQIPGDSRYERILHDHFDEYRIRGEWFRCEGRLADFVKLLPSLPAYKRPPNKREMEAIERAKEPRLRPIIEHPIFRAWWEDHRALLWATISGYGVDDFAALVGVRPWVINGAFSVKENVHYRVDWHPYLMRAVSCDAADRINAHFFLGTCLPLKNTQEENDRKLAESKWVIKQASQRISDYIELEWPHWGRAYAEIANHDSVGPRLTVFRAGFLEAHKRTVALRRKIEREAPGVLALVDKELGR